MLYISLNWLLIGCGFLGTTFLFSSRGKPQVVASSPRRMEIMVLRVDFSATQSNICSESAIVESMKVIMPAQATLGNGSLRLQLNTGWICKDVNIDDPLEVELAERLQMSALAHVAGSTSRAYVGPWNAFVI